MKDFFQIIGKTYKGLEEVLAKELIELGADEVEIGRRAVMFKGDKAMLYKANLCCRSATRFLVPLVTFEATDADDIYEQAKKIDWSEYMDVRTSFSIDSTVFSDQFTHSKFVTYRVKDAIADQFMEKCGKRPSVGLSNPDFMINIHIAQTTCTLSLDSTGESLHKRGYRVSQTDAPMSEALAAGMLLMAGWDGSCDFIDPMCGSGTMLIEAALIALNIPPGIFRKSFAFEKWRDFNSELFDTLYNDDSYEKEFTHKIYGSDISPIAIKIAEQNVKSAGMSKYISLQVKNLVDLDIPKEKMLMVTNPPYGERLKSENNILDLYGNIGRMLKNKFAGNQAWVISSEESYLACIGMKPSQKIELYNGSIDCLFCNYEVFTGARKDFIKDKIEKGEYKRDSFDNGREDDHFLTKRRSFDDEKSTRKRVDYSSQKPFHSSDRQKTDRDYRKEDNQNRYGDRQRYSADENGRTRSADYRSDKGERPNQRSQSFGRGTDDFSVKKKRFYSDKPKDKNYGGHRDKDDSSSCFEKKSNSSFRGRRK